jgi:hypothetical protein
MLKWLKIKYNNYKLMCIYNEYARDANRIYPIYYCDEQLPPETKDGVSYIAYNKYGVQIPCYFIGGKFILVWSNASNPTIINAVKWRERYCFYRDE